MLGTADLATEPIHTPLLPSTSPAAIPLAPFARAVPTWQKQRRSAPRGSAAGRASSSSSSSSIPAAISAHGPGSTAGAAPLGSHRPARGAAAAGYERTRTERGQGPGTPPHFPVCESHSGTAGTRGWQGSGCTSPSLRSAPRGWHMKIGSKFLLLKIRKHMQRAERVVGCFVSAGKLHRYHLQRERGAGIDIKQ